MKLRSLFVFSVIAAAPLVAQDEVPTVMAPTVPATTPQPAAPTRTFTEPEMLEMFGWFIGSNAGLGQLSLTVEEIAAVTKGLQINARGGNPPYDIQQIGEQMAAFMEKKQEAFMAGVLREELAKSEIFMSEVKKTPGVTVTPSGLVYQVKSGGDGTGQRPTPADIVRINVTGALVDGAIFERSQVYEGILNDFMPGWVEGLQLADKGSIIRLYIPPALAYGNEGNGVIPPGAALIFDIQLVEINPLPVTTP